MAGRTLEESLCWMADGTQIFLAAIDRLSDEDLADPTELDGWTGRHLVAHVAANAEALLNLVHWARTGEETLMYSSRSSATPTSRRRQPSRPWRCASGSVHPRSG